MEGDRLLRDASALWIRQGVEQSLRDLRVDYIDLYQLHWPDPNTPFKETASTLDQLIHEGKIRYVGVSNYNVEQMRAFEKTIKLDALQPPLQSLPARYRASYPALYPGAWHRGARVRAVSAWSARWSVHATDDLRSG
jgi:aryl-alcohol dehydrogenase-like predicted oxidoreductase